MATRLPTGALREHNSNVAGEILRTPWPAKGYLRWGEILASGGRTSGYGHIGSPGRGLLAGRHSRTRSAAAGSLSRGKRMSTWSAHVVRSWVGPWEQFVASPWQLLFLGFRCHRAAPPRLEKALMRVQWGHISSETTHLTEDLPGYADQPWTR